VAAAGVVLRRAKRTLPRRPRALPCRSALARDVNFTVFMNIYINLHFTAASATTQRRRGGGLGWGGRGGKKKGKRRVHDDVESPSFIPATTEAARMKNLDNNLRLVLMAS